MKDVIFNCRAIASNSLECSAFKHCTPPFLQIQITNKFVFSLSSCNSLSIVDARASLGLHPQYLYCEGTPSQCVIAQARKSIVQCLYLVQALDEYNSYASIGIEFYCTMESQKRYETQWSILSEEWEQEFCFHASHEEEICFRAKHDRTFCCDAFASHIPSISIIILLYKERHV